VVDREQALLDQLVEVEPGGVGRHADLPSRLLAADPVVAAGDELVETAAERVGQRPDRGERISHADTST
jgi:hypothetical protein